jgi:hypothetical protein
MFALSPSHGSISPTLWAKAQMRRQGIPKKVKEMPPDILFTVFYEGFTP